VDARFPEQAREAFRGVLLELGLGPLRGNLDQAAQGSRDWAVSGEQSGEQTEGNWDALEHAEVNVSGSRQPSRTASHWLGAGRSQVQILSPRSEKGLQTGRFPGVWLARPSEGLGNKFVLSAGVVDAVVAPWSVVSPAPRESIARLTSRSCTGVGAAWAACSAPGASTRVGACAFATLAWP
jgi:hypothetical protein